MANVTVPSQSKTTQSAVSASNECLSNQFNDFAWINIKTCSQIVFKNITYTVAVKEKSQALSSGQKFSLFSKKRSTLQKQLLSDVSGVFRQGRLTAIMGASGAGKTSLLNILAGEISKKGNVSGNIFVNGIKTNSKTMRKISGFVFQDDVILPTMTAQEAVEMSAVLRLPTTISKTDKLKTVQDIIKILNLENATNTAIGTPITHGISGGERKRVSVAMELVINPSILFLDEPTSGLDTLRAYLLVKSLSDLTKLNRTIIATIHQPSSTVFHLFDDLILLSEGKIVYCGTIANVVPYFAKLGYQCPTYNNPADYLFMEVLKEDHLSSSVSHAHQTEGTTNAGSYEGISVQMEQNLTTELSIYHPIERDTGDAEFSSTPTYGARNSSINPHDSLSQKRTYGQPPYHHNLTSSVISLSSEKLPSSLTADIENHAQDLGIPRCSTTKSSHLQAFQEAWKASNEYNVMMETYVQPVDSVPSPEDDLTHLPVSINYQASGFWIQFKFLFRRAFKNMIRNKMSSQVKLFQAVVMGLLIGLIYKNIDSGSLSAQKQGRMGSLYFLTINFFTSSVMSTIMVYSEEKMVFLREYRAGYYCLSAYFLSKILVELPFYVFFPFVTVTIAYLLIGLKPVFTSYLVFLSVCILLSNIGVSVGLFTSFLFPSLSTTLAFVPLIILPLIMFSGYLVNVDGIPPYLDWLKHISPTKYAFQAIVYNQFRGHVYSSCPLPSPTCYGEEQIKGLGFDKGFSLGECVIMLTFMYLFTLLMTGLCLKWKTSRTKR